MSVTLAVILDNRRMKKTGSYPTKLRVTFNRSVRYYPTVIDLSEDDFNRLQAPHLSRRLQQVKVELDKIKSDAQEAVKGIQPFNFEDFEGGFVQSNPLFVLKPSKALKLAASTLPIIPSNELPESVRKKYSIFDEVHNTPGTISIVYRFLVEKMLLEERIGTARSYNLSYQSLKNFKGNVRFQDITVSYLQQYERWMINQGNSKTTIGMYLRALRAVFNEAIAQKIIKKDDCYPFGRRLYRIPTGRNIKKALELSEIQKIYNYQPRTESERKAKEFWLFSYFGNGMNVKDIALLKRKDIKGDYLSFVRAKTERTTREDPKPVVVYITEDMQRIINTWGNEEKEPESYIFPILTPVMTAQEQYDNIQLFIKFINKWMKHIKGMVKIDKKLTTIVTRHSFSSVLKRSGASTEFIQEALGHTDKKTTENYLDSFEVETKKQFAEKLSAFKQLPISEAS